jgi:hypothetical protein
MAAAASSRATCPPTRSTGQRGVAQGHLVKRHGPLGGELAEGDLQPAAVAGGVPDAVQLEVEQLAEADAGAAQHCQPGAGEWVGQLADGGHQVPVGVRRKGAGRKVTYLPGQDKIRADVTISPEISAGQTEKYGVMGRVRGGT